MDNFILRVCDGWIEPHHRIILGGTYGGDVSHGMCEECEALMNAAIDAKETVRAPLYRHMGAVRVAGLALLFVLMVRPVGAEPLRIPASVFIAGITADTVTTWQTLSRGSYEANTLLPKSAPMIAATKAVVGTMVLLLAKRLDTMGHPKVARVLLYSGGSASLVIAGHNAKVGR